MPLLHPGLRVLVYTTYNKTSLVDDLSGKYTALRFSTALHGGFKDCQLSVPMGLDRAWLYLSRENLPGRHFYHLEISEQSRIIWEGRIMNIGLRIDPNFEGLDITAFGYWSSCRDKYYDPDDAGNTDWTVGGPHVVSKIIKEMLTSACPDINSDQSNIAANSRDIAGINLKTRAYPQDNIIDSLAPLGDSDGSIWYFAIWENRVPYWQKRTAATVQWYIYLQDISNLRLTQQAMHLRNYILPVTGTAEGTGTLNAESTAVYGIQRQLIINLPGGVPSASANDARDLALVEKKIPRQDENFEVKGHLYGADISDKVNLGAAANAFAEQPKWRIRAGSVVRIQDLVPVSANSPALDDLRTFYILETSYDAMTDALTIQPDRPASRLDTLLARISQLERDK